MNGTPTAATTSGDVHAHDWRMATASWRVALDGFDTVGDLNG
jgi:hypothetical protein